MKLISEGMTISGNSTTNLLWGILGKSDPSFFTQFPDRQNSIMVLLYQAQKWSLRHTEISQDIDNIFVKTKDILKTFFVFVFVDNIFSLDICSEKVMLQLRKSKKLFNNILPCFTVTEDSLREMA